MRHITADFIYPLDNFEPIKLGYVDVDDSGRVLAYGKAESKSEEHYEGALVPGFVNCHCHIELSHLHRKFRKGTGMAGFLDQINSLRDWAGFDVKEQLVRDWLKTMWDRGVSAMADISNDDSSFLPKKESPLYTRTFIELFGDRPEDCESIMDGAFELQKKATSMGIDAAPTPHSCYTMSPELVSASSKAGLESGYLSYHSQESAEEEELMISGSGALYENRLACGIKTPPVTGRPSLLYFLDRLAAFSSLPVSGKVLLVHNVQLSQEAIDAALSSLSNPYWAVCPLSNIFIHNSVPPIDLMRRNRLKITVGTDSLSSNDDLDMIKEIYCLQTEFPEVQLGEILSWACLNGASFLSKDYELGSIAVGKKPGLVWVKGVDEVGRLTSDCSSRRII